jgi:ribonuclease HI
MGSIGKDYKDRNIYILLNIQAAIKVLNNFQINSKLLWDCHHSLIKLAEHTRVQLVWVPGHMRIDGNEVADYLAREISSHPLRRHEHALGISAKVARGVIGD